MKLRQFKYLSNEDQEYILQKKAVWIGTLIDPAGDYTLFQVDGFYLEVLFSRKDREIRSIHYFEETEKLKPYLDVIDLSPVYEILKATG